MLPLFLNRPDGRPLRILCLGAHADDIEIGCSATLMKLLSKDASSSVRWIVFSAPRERVDEARAGARRMLTICEHADVSIRSWRDGFFPSQFEPIKDYFEAELKQFNPDVIFTHRREDRHQDHRLVSDLTWNTFRNHLILEYEIPKYDGDLGQPNCFVEIPVALVNDKIELILETFDSQHGKHWFTEETFRALMRLRGVECAASSGFAEAFHASKMTLL